MEKQLLIFQKSGEIQISDDSVGTITSAGTFYDTLAYGGLYLYKYDSATGGAPAYGSGATLEGIQFAIINNNNWEIVNYDTGVNIPKGGVAAVITTDANGYAATGNRALPAGDYIVKELRAGSTFNGTTLVEGTSDFANYFYQIRQSTTSIGAMHRMGVGECLFLIDF